MDHLQGFILFFYQGSDSDAHHRGRFLSSVVLSLPNAETLSAIPRVVVTRSIKFRLLLLHGCHFALVVNGNAIISYVESLISNPWCDLQAENFSFTY